MSPELNSWLQLLFRWAHVVAGVIWIGHLYFFNFVNANFAKTMDGPTKKAVVPELMPRALYFFRWGAAWTWTTGILLLGMVYYMGGTLWDDANNPGSGGIAAGLLVASLVCVYLYDVIMKAMKANQMAANGVALAILAGLYLALEHVAKFSGRALYIHVGAIFGTVMALNVWMRIWPAQKKIITAIKEGTPPDADLVALAGLRSRHNTFMSVPLLFTMMSSHYPLVYGSPYRDVFMLLFVVVGFATTIWLYKTSAEVKGF